MRNCLNRAFSRSICECASSHNSGVCRNYSSFDISTDLDMVWIPWLDGWYCCECYKLYYKDWTFEEFMEAYDIDIANGMDFDEDEFKLKFQK